ncbi:uncharacterized protein LOC121862007 [Homarus americanus]|uniref:uncharacterized protein LOC121862007 n=1 Tax=Homarus americanus TaxID=6706 RepID=UPI001C44CBC1|nr:uncharacterized protein LOC121862007 [Homarus americanus]
MNASLADISTLTILRKKICLRDSEVEADGVSVEMVEARHSTTVVYITLACLAVFLVVVVVLAIVNQINNNKNAPGRRRAGSSQRSGGGRQGNVGLAQSVPNNQRGGADIGGVGKTSQSSLSEMRRSPQPTNTTTATTTTTTGSPEPQYTDPRQSDISAKLTGLRVARECLQLLEVEQEGTFGRVYHALYQPPDQSHPTTVTVKTVTGESHPTTVTVKTVTGKVSSFQKPLLYQAMQPPYSDNVSKKVSERGFSRLT